MVLKDDKIYYFNAPNDAKPKGQIELGPDCFLQKADEYTNQEHSFGVYHNQKRVFFLKADSAQECNEWIEAIQYNIRQLARNATDDN